MLGPNSDLIIGHPHHLSFVQPLLLGDQSSLDEGVAQEDVDDVVVAGVDLSTRLLAAAHYVLRVQLHADSAAEARRLYPLLFEIFSLPDTEEILLNLSDHLQGLWSAVH